MSPPTALVSPPVSGPCVLQVSVIKLPDGSAHVTKAGAPPDPTVAQLQDFFSSHDPAQLQALRKQTQEEAKANVWEHKRLRKSNVCLMRRGMRSRGKAQGAL